ncbi:cytochrome c biogenesis CcdA family protein [Thermaerobacter subterraneus]|uniref:Cytochrome c biogenesis protein n=1 Tax=Thermaerobacter subterraneus DSM 13965 TaxID=867903 RepID=K6P1Z4_9FIRM|nr:cytochrome c biogenesis CcdA family protein [Thermaerobacter subterraneus]EKP95080.1 cytochrome c biogenesis protein [Thermaerobacter subterraneus DSM 13965]
MGPETQVTAGIALLAGMAYFFSPCVWPLYPAYLALLGGTAGPAQGTARPGPATAPGGLRHPSSRRLAGAAGFVLGLGLVFMATGASLSAAGALLIAYKSVLEKVAGVLIVFFGLQMLGVIRLRWLQREWRPAWAQAPTAGAGGFWPGTLMGAAFGVGWTPCVGPVLGSILLLASSTGTVAQGMLLLAAFTAGFAVPFFTLAVLIDRLQPDRLRRGGPLLRRVEQASGVALVLLGVLVLTGQLAYIASWLWYTVQP